MAWWHDDRKGSAIAWLVVAAIHIAAGVWLLRMRPLPEASTIDVVLQVEFVGRVRTAAPTVRPTMRSPSAAANVMPDTRTSTQERVKPGPTLQVERSLAATADSRAASSALQRPLDLRLPDAGPVVAPRDPLRRAPALDARGTRFARAWVPDGNAMEQAAFRSPAVAVAMGLFGGPPKKCTEVERRLRVANCLPLHGQEADDELLRRELDD